MGSIGRIPGCCGDLNDSDFQRLRVRYRCWDYAPRRGAWAAVVASIHSPSPSTFDPVLVVIQVAAGPFARDTELFTAAIPLTSEMV